MEARETAHPWTDISVYDSKILELKLFILEFQPSKQGRQELPQLILQCVLVINYY